MKAILCTKYGTPDGLQLKEVEKPAPKNNEVQIKIYATTVTAGDVMLRKLRWPLRLVFGLKINSILGHELAGEVEDVGREVTKFLHLPVINWVLIPNTYACLRTE